MGVCYILLHTSHFVSSPVSNTEIDLGCFQTLFYRAKEHSMQCFDKQHPS